MAREEDLSTSKREQAARAALAREDEDAFLEDGPGDDLDLRAQELEAPDPAQQFLRGQKRVPVRRALPKKTANRLKTMLIGASVAAGMLVALGLFYNYGTSSWRFRLDSSDQIEYQGVEHVQRAQIMEIMGGDIGRNIFFVPLEERRRQIEEIPWVESASVMRLLPNRIRIQVKERTPVAFVRIGSKVALIDANGVVMELPTSGQKKYSFPVITGMLETEPLSTRAARMKIHTQLVRELDSEGANYSKDLSEIDLSDPADVKVTVSDAGGTVLVHLGGERFLERYKIYIANVQQWRQQFNKLESVDLRYDRQIIVNPDPEAAQPAPTAQAVQ